MVIYRLTIEDPYGQIRAHFTNKVDACQTYLTTYAKIERKPEWKVEPLEVLERATHL